MALPKLFSKKFLGIDIGTSAVRLVELEQQGDNLKLANYGEVQTEIVQGEALRITKKAMAIFSVEEIAMIIRAIMAETKIRTRQCAFSIPDYSTFFTSFTLPPMTEKELPDAVMFEARQHIPLPLESVAVDWQLVGGGFDEPQDLQIVMAAIPNEIIQQYKLIAANAKLEVVALEAEVFGLLRSLVPKTENQPVCLVDIGAQSTVCSIVENGVVKSSYSFDVAGNYILEESMKGLSLDPDAEREIRERYGLKFFPRVREDMRTRAMDVLFSSFGAILKEIQTMLATYVRHENKDVAKIIITGGTALIPGIKDHFSNFFSRAVEIADPFTEIIYPPALTEELRAVGPLYAVAVGMAQRGFDLRKPKQLSMRHEVQPSDKDDNK